MNDINNKFSILYLSDDEDEEYNLDIEIKIDLLESQLLDLKDCVKSVNYISNNNYKKIIDKQIIKIENNINTLKRYYKTKNKNDFYYSLDYIHFCCEIYH